ncbi:MAG: hypothetical protein WCA35_18860, partial [Kovacikia sp.]
MISIQQGYAAPDLATDYEKTDRSSLSAKADEIPSPPPVVPTLPERIQPLAPRPISPLPAASLLSGAEVDNGSAPTPLTRPGVSPESKPGSRTKELVSQVPDPSQNKPDPNRDRFIQPAPTPIPTPPEQIQPIIPTPQ